MCARVCVAWGRTQAVSCAAAGSPGVVRRCCDGRRRAKQQTANLAPPLGALPCLQSGRLCHSLPEPGCSEKELVEQQHAHIAGHPGAGTDNAGRPGREFISLCRPPRDNCPMRRMYTLKCHIRDLPCHYGGRGGDRARHCAWVGAHLARPAGRLYASPQSSLCILKSVNDLLSPSKTVECQLCTLSATDANCSTSSGASAVSSTRVYLKLVTNEPKVNHINTYDVVKETGSCAGGWQVSTPMPCSPAAPGRCPHDRINSGAPVDPCLRHQSRTPPTP